MNTSVSVRDLFRSLGIALVLMLALVAVSRGQDTPTPTAPPTPPAAASENSSGLRRLDLEPTPVVEPVSPAVTEVAPATPPEPTPPPSPSNRRRNRRGIVATGSSHDDRVEFGQSAYLGKGEQAEAVVAILGSATSEGTVRDTVVAVIGNAHVTGPVGDSVVAVLGNVYINSKVAGEVVAVLGDVELGPLAEVSGEIIVVGGTLKQDPAAVTHGRVQRVGVTSHLSGLVGLRAWFKECVLYARPLAIGLNLGWAWSIALCLLALYALLALLFGKGVERCVETLEQRPGGTVLAALLTILITPVLFVLLGITVVGLVAIPFAGIGLFFAGLFGRAVMLAWIGRRLSKTVPLPVAVLLGGAVVLGLYLVPVLGFIVYMGLKLMALGVAVFTLLLAARREKAVVLAPVGGVPATVPMSTSPSAGFTSSVPVAPVMPVVVTPLVDEIPASFPLPPLSTPTPSSSTAQPPLQPPVVTPLIPAATLPRAGFWIRTAAMVIDLMLVAIVLGHWGSSAFFLGMVAYGAVMWKLKATTVGGIICGLKVVRLDDRPIDWPTAIVRALGCILSVAVACLGFIWVVFDDERQSWHDKIGGTVVVKMPKGFSLV